MRLSPAARKFMSRSSRAWYIWGVSTFPHSGLEPPPPPPPLIGGESPACLRYIARQPILNRDRDTHGYELLFRSGPENFFKCADPDLATCHTIDLSLFSDSLTGPYPAFINCTRNILVRDVITVLPRDRVVIEVLEDVTADEEVMAACDRLRRAGYLIALDDYVATPDSMRLLPFADIVKVDFVATDAARQAAIAAEMRRRGIRLLAEKVESREQFDFAMRLGYHYFQGYFFCKPQSLAMQDIPSSKLSYMYVLSIANSESYNVSELERAILREPSLCYRLLRYLNSAAFGLFPIRSIRHALSLLGQREIQKWVSIVVAISLSADCPSELISSALIRARACEALAAATGDDASGAFIVGIMSLMDAILDCPMEAVTARLPLAAPCKDALRGSDNSLGKLLRLAICCERGAWHEISAIAAECGLDEDIVWERHREACRWSGAVLKENRGRTQ
jgi:EAL and modified HD-GYP domain-containing signal transduction protein